MLKVALNVALNVALKVALKVVFTGDRNWSDIKRVKQIFRSIPKDSIIIVGDAKGLDYFVEKIASEANMKVIVYKAEWDKYGLKAGPIRNRLMINENQPDLIIGFHNDIKSSKGTLHTLNYGKLKGIKTYLVTDNSFDLY